MTSPHSHNPPTYFIRAFGCQMNRSDATLLADFFEGLGLRPADAPESADVVHVLTCGVRQKAEDKFFSYLGALGVMKTQRPRMVIGVGGCIPAFRDVTKDYRFVDYITGTGAPDAYEAEIIEALRRAGPFSSESGACHASSLSEFYTVIRGCTNNCAYCVVPAARGAERSVPVDRILADVSARAAGGVREITLLGQNILAYGADLTPSAGLADALRAIHRLDGLLRIRFVTSHPVWVTPEFLEAMRGLPKVCEHFHVPFQSGDDEILNMMNRGYTAETYRNTVSLIRKYFPGAAITADAIVGFPGETEAQFANTIRLVREVEVDSLFSFKYSPRPGTAALSLRDDVSADEKKERLRGLNDLQRRISLKKNQALVGTEQEILVEETLARDVVKYRGRTRTNKVTEFTSTRELRAGDIARVRVARATPFALQGESA